MAGNVFQHNKLFGVRCPTTGNYRLLRGPGLGSTMLEGGAHKSTANMFSCGRLFPNLAAVHACVATMSPPPSPLLLEDSPEPAGRSIPGSYQITSFALDPSAYEVLCMPFKSEVPFFFYPLELLKLSPSGP